jgi:methyl-accepting chemotaxis protein
MEISKLNFGSFIGSIKGLFKQAPRLETLLRKGKIRTRLIVSLIMLSVVPLLIVGYVSYTKSSDAIRSKIGSYSIQMADQVAGNISIIMKQTEKYCSESLISEQDDLRSFAAAGGPKRLAAQNKLIDRLSQRFSTVDGVVLAGALAKDYSTTGFGQISDLRQSDMDRFFMLSDSKKTENNGWNLIDLQGYGSCASLVKPLISDTGERVGVFLTVLRKNSFASVFKDINLGEDSKIFLMDSAGKVISCKENLLDIGKNYPDAELIKHFNKLPSNGERTFTIQSNGEKRLVTYSKISDTSWYIVNTIPYSYLNSESSNIGIRVLILCLLFLAIAVLLSYLLSESISKPLGRMVVLMDEAGSGNLVDRIEDDSIDEIGKVLSKYDIMIAKINALISSSSLLSRNVTEGVKEITDSAVKMQGLSGHVASTIYQIAQGSSEQASDAGRSVQYMENLSQSINAAGADLDTVSDIVGKTIFLVENALAIVKSLNSTAQRNDAALRVITENIGYLKNDMRQVESIVKVINRISEQTNLLALNAAIEAAKVGKAGSGFTVVANEVKKLADQTREASTSINNIINSAQNQTERTKLAANNANSVMEEQMHAVEQTDRAFKDILDAMESVTANTEKITTSIKGISILKEKTLESICNISAVSEEASAIVEEVASITHSQMAESETLSNLAKNLSGLAQELGGKISVFKIREEF